MIKLAIISIIFCQFTY